MWCFVEFFSPVMATRLYSVDEVVAFMNLDHSDIDQEDLVKDVDSDDGDAEEPDYICEDGSSQLIPSEFLSEPGLHSITAVVEQITLDEPHLQDSLLLLDDDLLTYDELQEEMDIEQGNTEEVTEDVSEFEAKDSDISDTDSMSADEEDGRMNGGRRGGRGRVHGRRSKSRGRGRGRAHRSGQGSRGRGRGRGHGRGQGSRGCGRGRGQGRGHRSQVYRREEWEWNTSYDDDSTQSAPPPFDEEAGPTSLTKDSEIPIDFLKLIFTDELIDTIVIETNAYATQKGYNIMLSREDILGYLGMNIAMGIVGLPEVSDYWTREPLLNHPWFPSVMSSKKFLVLSRFLHFTDNTSAPSREDPDYNKLWKIQPVLRTVQEQSKKMYNPGGSVSIDESMIGTKARLSFLQYLPKKPTKWGVKVWVCADADTAYIYNFRVYTGKSDTNLEHGLAYRVVMNLLEDVMDSGRTLYTDNFYSSPVLFQDLYDQGIYATGTCRSNKIHFPKSILPGQMGLDKGVTAFRHHGPITCGRWLDKRDVLFLSTKCRDGIEMIERRCKGGNLESVNKPKIICDYNANMAGVDKADQLMVYYACGRKSLKWYKRIFWRILDHSILNAFILYKSLIDPGQKRYTQKKFRMELAYALTAPLLATRLGQGRRSPIHGELRRLKGKHFPYYHEKRKRCIVCGYKKRGPYSTQRKDTKTKNYCQKCEVHLCHGVCFERYHTLHKY